MLHKLLSPVLQSCLRDVAPPPNYLSDGTGLWEYKAQGSSAPTRKYALPSRQGLIKFTELR